MPLWEDALLDFNEEGHGVDLEFEADKKSEIGEKNTAGPP